MEACPKNMIVKIIENMQYVHLFQVKDMLQREHEGMSRKVNNEMVLKAT